MKSAHLLCNHSKAPKSCASSTVPFLNSSGLFVYLTRWKARAEEAKQAATPVKATIPPTSSESVNLICSPSLDPTNESTSHVGLEAVQGVGSKDWRNFSSAQQLERS